MEKILLIFKFKLKIIHKKIFEKIGMTFVNEIKYFIDDHTEI
jgi:hypothetical protein